MYSSLNELLAGDRIKVIKEFKDFDNQQIAVGSEWTFKKYTYFPYDGGYTFYFEEGVIRMAEISEPDYYVFNHASEYFILLKDDLSNTK
jgi:Domain of unknown function (DUF3601)